MDVPCKSEPFLNVLISKTEVKALIDTGAQISAITKDVYDDLINTGNKVISIPIKKFALKDAFNNKGSTVAAAHQSSAPGKRQEVEGPAPSS